MAIHEGPSSTASDPIQPHRECDLVMQGGITSGVVYPSALLELYQQGYRFRNIGGASAGAIAAGLAAAAEHGRRTTLEGEEGGGFERLQCLLDQIKGVGFLPHLFTPARLTWALLNVADALAVKSIWDKAGRMVAALVRDVTGPTATGAFLGVLLWYGIALCSRGSTRFPLQYHNWTLCLFELLPLVLFIMFGSVIGGGLALWHMLTRTMPDHNLFGICTGHTPGACAGPDGVLTDWMVWAVDFLAGRRTANGNYSGGINTPLTFRDLMAGNNPSEGEAFAVRLQMVTSNLSQGLPYRLPFENTLLLFKKGEMEKLFPPDIVNALIDRSPSQIQSSGCVVDNQSTRAQFYVLPDGPDLPVVFCMRLSLSFPILISAVPLYTVKAEAMAKANAPIKLNEADLQRNWFSDGGLCSNFPIHMFDAWLPRRPTFGIALKSMPQDQMDQTLPDKLKGETLVAPVQASSGTAASGSHQQCAAAAMSKFLDAVYLSNGADPAAPEWSTFTTIFGFASALLTTAKDWQDSLESLLPSYRDRIVQVRLASYEGGLNLNMDEKTVQGIVAKGKESGQVLEGFDWDDHRWTRYQVLMGRLENQLQAFRASTAPPECCRSVSKADPRRCELQLSFDYAGLAQQQLKKPADFSYPRDQEWVEQTSQIMDELRRLICLWRPADIFQQKSPLPEPVLRVTPDV